MAVYLPWDQLSKSDNVTMQMSHSKPRDKPLGLDVALGMASRDLNQLSMP